MDSRSRPKSYRIFLASPSDVSDERALALRVLDYLPYDPALRGKVSIEAVAWDKLGGPPMEANLTPQEAIRRGLPRPAECDIFVAMLWARLGTPVVIEGEEYRSGTVWEYRDAMRAAEASGLPRVLVYRRTEKISLDPERDDFEETLSQYRSVKEFFSQFKNVSTGQITGGYNSYESPDDLREALERHLRFLLEELLESERPYSAASTHVAVDKDYHSTHEAIQWTGSPFPGLRALKQEEEPIFFGRSRELDALVRVVRNSEFTAIVGASGSGKSSLVSAGLVPRLVKTARSGSWVPVFLTPDHLGTGNPFATLAAALMGDLPTRPPARLAAKLEAKPAHIVDVCGDSLAHESPGARVLLFIDQFEELFTTVDPRYVPGFVDALRAAMKADGIRVVVTLRGDFFGQCLDTPGLAALLRSSTFPLAAPRQTDLHQMIVRPALRAGLEFEPGLTDRILDDTGTESGSLALMAYLLDELYHACGGSGLLTHAAYDELGGVQGGIGARSESTFQTLDLKSQESLPDVFRELVEVDERGTATRRRESLERVAPDAGSKRLVKVMTEARLLVQGQGAQNKAFVEVAHEALLSSWDRLALWIGEVQDDLRLLRQVRLAAKEWWTSDQSPTHLWPHERLLPVYEMQKNLRLDFDPVVTEFIQPELERLAREYDHPDTLNYRRLNIIDRFAEIGESAFARVIMALKPRNANHVRLRAVRAVRDMKISEAIPTLIEIAEGESTWGTVTKSAIKVLGQLNATQAAPSLLNVARSNAGRSDVAIRALGAMKASGAIPVLRKIAQARFTKGTRGSPAGETERKRRSAAIDVLAQFGDRESAPIFVSFLEEGAPEGYRWGLSQASLVAAARALGRFEYGDAVPVLTTIAQDVSNKSVAGATRAALKRIRKAQQKSDTAAAKARRGNGRGAGFEVED